MILLICRGSAAGLSFVAKIWWAQLIFTDVKISCQSLELFDKVSNYSKVKLLQFIADMFPLYIELNNDYWKLTAGVTNGKFETTLWDIRAYLFLQDWHFFKTDIPPKWLCKMETKSAKHSEMLKKKKGETYKMKLKFCNTLTFLETVSPTPHCKQTWLSTIYSTLLLLKGVVNDTVPFEVSVSSIFTNKTFA